MKSTTKHLRFFVPHESIVRSSFSSKDKGLSNQIANVFRLKKGARISVFDGSGYEYVVELTRLGKENIEGVIISKEFKKSDYFSRVNIFCPVLKGSNFELVLQKCTELGVSVFCPVMYKNSVVKVADKKGRWQKIVREASEQCGRVDVPNIFDPISFSEVLGYMDKKGASNIVAEHGAELKARDLFGILKKGGELNVLVGPEGGFSDQEVSKLREKECLFLSLGEGILRAETACILVVGILSNL